MSCVSLCGRGHGLCLVLCSFPVVDALPQQEQWKFAALPPPAATFYEHISSALDSSLCIQLLQRAITVEKVTGRSGSLEYEETSLCSHLPSSTGLLCFSLWPVF